MMRIDSYRSFQDNTAKVGQESTSVANPSTDRSRGSASAGVADRAQLSVNAERVRELMTALNSLPDVRQDRVDQVRQAIQQGRYQVSSEKIADAMFAEYFGPSGIE